MPDNPYSVVGAPSYAAPLVNWQSMLGQGQGGQRPAGGAPQGQPQAPGGPQAQGQQGLAQRLQQWLAQGQGQQPGAQQQQRPAPSPNLMFGNGTGAPAPGQAGWSNAGTGGAYYPMY